MGRPELKLFAGDYVFDIAAGLAAALAGYAIGALVARVEGA